MRTELVKKTVAAFFKDYPLKTAGRGTSFSVPGWLEQNATNLTPEERREVNTMVDRQIMSKKSEGVARLEETLENIANFKGKKAPPFKGEAADDVEDGMRVQAHGTFAKGLKDGETYTLKNSGGSTFYFVNKNGIKAHRNDATTIARWLRGGEAGDGNGLTFADKEENIANFKGKKAPPFKKESRLERLIHEAEASKSDYEALLKEVKDGRAILTAQDIHKDVPTIHNFAGKYHSSVEHYGYGMFKGKTEHGEFTFDAGGAMRHAGAISWTPLDAEAAVLKDLKYDLKKVEKALQELADKE